MASANFTVNGVATPPEAEVSAGSTVNLALVDITDVRTVSWSFIGNHDPDAVAPTITPAGSPSGRTASFVMPNVIGGQAWLLQCIVNGGVDTNGTIQSTLTKRALVGVIDSVGTIPFASGETNERHEIAGYTPALNALRSASGGTPAISAYKDPVVVATTTALATNTRSGNVLTASANGALASIDGVSLSVSSRLLVKDEAATEKNGIYTVTSLGSGGAPWQLTRATDADSGSEVVSGIAVTVANGSTNKGKVFVLTTPNPITLNTTGQTWESSSSGGSGVTIAPVRLVATSNLDLNGAETIDGVATANGDRIAVIAQSTAAQNGIYTANHSGAWSRVSDFATASQMQAAAGATFLVTAGTSRANSLITLTTTGTIVVGTTALNFAMSPSPPTSTNALKFLRVNAAGDNYDYVSSAGTVTARAVLITNVTHSGTLTYDGFAITAGMVVLDAGATTAATRGLWTVQSGAWTRPTETQTPGMVVTISDGTYGRGTQWQMAGAQPFTLDTTAQTWERTDGGAKDGKVNTATTTPTLIRAIPVPRGKYCTLHLDVKARRVSDDEVNMWQFTVAIKTLADGTVTYKPPNRRTIDDEPALGNPDFSVGTALFNVLGIDFDTTSLDWTVGWWISDQDNV